MLENYPPERLRSAAPSEISDALERGSVVLFPVCPVELPAATQLALLRERLPAGLDVKNVSFHPESDRTHGIRDDAQLREIAHRLLKTHSERVEAFLRETIPSLTAGWTVGTSSFRPIEERGRNLCAHASNELVHIDAGAYGATNGDRILRFFVNVNPTTERVWASKGTFPYLYRRYGTAAGIASAAGDPQYSDLRRGLLDNLRSSLLRGLRSIGVKEAMVVDSSPYDRVMRRFHNFMKDDPQFQATRDDYVEYRFPPMTAWMVLTDMVSHASVSGQHALVNTFLLRLESCRLPELAPFNILRGIQELSESAA